MIDGYGNGWLIDPAVYGTGPIDIHVEWMPQRIVWICIWLSVAGVVACLLLILLRPGRRVGLSARTGPDHPLDPTLGLGLRRPSLAASWPVDHRRDRRGIGAVRRAHDAAARRSASR